MGGHSHDSADRVDDALADHASGRRALWVSLAALLGIAAVQAVIVAFTGSAALLGDTLHTVADASTALPLLLAFAVAGRTPNDRFTWGYGRAEDLAGVFVVVMIAVSAVIAASTALGQLLDPHPVEHPWAVAAAGVVGFIGNELVARYRIRVGRSIGSAALVADGLHARADGITSLAVVAGAVGVWVGWPWADGVVGLGIAAAILGVLVQAARQVGARLMDAVDPHLVAALRDAVATGPATVESVRLRWIGHRLHADAVLRADPGLSLAESHLLAVDAEERAQRALPKLSSISIHVCPGTHRPER